MNQLSRRSFLIAGAGAGLAVVAPLPAVAATTTIPITYQQQVAQNWCSAASTRIALSAAGRLPSQQDLANALELGAPGGAGLRDPYAIARVLNNRLGIASSPFRYKLGQDLENLDDYVEYGVSVNKPVVYNVNRVAEQSYTASGHYICLYGRRNYNGRIQFRIADPDSPARTGNWYYRSDVLDWQRYGRYTAYRLA